jgi:hypothetical protein
MSDETRKLALDVATLWREWDEERVLTEAVALAIQKRK